MSGLAEDEIGVSPLVRGLRVGAGVVLAIASVAALVVIVQGLLAGSKVPGKQVTKITVLDTPPPPPPPKEEPKREPPKESPKEVKLEQPRPVEQPPQEAQQLKMEGQAGDGPSAFASGAVTQDYVGGPLGTGAGGGGTLQYAFFTNALQRHIQTELARNRKVKGAEYRVQVAVWIARDGAIQRAELGSTTGSAESDEALRSALLELGPLRTAVPPNMPQPVRLRISNRITG